MKIRFGGRSLSLRGLLGLKRDRVPNGYTHIDRFLPEDVFIVGYPKSGNTWFQHLVSGLVYGVDARHSPPLLANDLVPDVHLNPFYRRYSTPMYFKSHSLPRPDYRKVVYLLRDGRDAMVSYWHYLEALRRRKLDFLELVTAGAREIPCKWHEHVDAWQGNPHGAEMIVIKYEDMLRKPVDQLERFCDFIGLECERSRLEAAAGAAQFRILHEKEARLGMGRPGDWPADKFFFRRGIMGSYKDEMPTTVLTAFLREAESALQRNGYLDEQIQAYSSRANANGHAKSPAPAPLSRLPVASASK
jgi:Sulfotransferase domain